MSDFSLFLKKNKLKKENIKIPATSSLVDEKGMPLLWEIRAITTSEENMIRDECTREIPVKGKPNLYRPKLNTDLYLKKIAVRCIIYPDLNNKQLQDSYGVMCAEDLIPEIIDNAGEYNIFMNKLQEYNGYNGNFQDEIDEAKN